ncbi:pyridoxamine 5'-phosphate oxidase family protein [Azohydromonas sp.]|uniref:pyridoxamine 5'-phosphate oxidase family protein n=1 Tax=Azohydromonas sp. TaxID=1872666 RepID=UPI002B8A4503|nr:pyridoxamine 5'-phosphate oxidase family protein [Azohydromonas sp.]HMM84049.1 pyridoxamine 5'-phosphate oxidase family protein [Azohydromonas sp.]
MASIEGVCREVCDATEYVTIVTNGPDGPHLAGHWGSYMRIVEPGETVVFPVGRFQRTEQNLRANGRIQLMVASRKVQGTRSPGQGCVIDGTGEVVASGEYVDLVREKFPWARGALVVQVASVSTQL